MLDLAPQTESRVLEYAAADGVSTDEYINRLLEQAAPRAAVSLPAVATASGEEMRVRFLALLALPKEEVARLNAASIARLEAQLAEAGSATPDEIAQAESEWEAHKRAMNENRRATGERLLYPDRQP